MTEMITDKATDAPPVQPPPPKSYAVFAVDKRNGTRIQITKRRTSFRGAKLDQSDVEFGSDGCLLNNRIAVQEIA